MAIANLNHTLQFALTCLGGGRRNPPQTKTSLRAPVAPWEANAASGSKRRTASPRIGVVGPRRGFGLASQNWDLAKFVNVTKWLGRDPVTDQHGKDAERLAIQLDTVSRDMSPIELEAWFDGLDALVFIESPAYSGLTAVAQSLGVTVACIPNWEWLHPGLPWLADVDAMICPTRHTWNVLSDWKHRFGFRWTAEYLAWPIDTRRFGFVQRNRCERFLFINGSGGSRAREQWDESGSATPVRSVRRKGLDLVLDAAAQAPGVPIIIYSADDDVAGAVPPNVELRPQVGSNPELYREGDVCIQPSRWEGLGLPALECQAAGLPLITTDFPPMNEHSPLALFPVRNVESMFLGRQLCIPVPVTEPSAIADVLCRFHGRRIGDASQRSRRTIEEKHNWRSARRFFHQLLGGVAYDEC